MIAWMLFSVAVASMLAAAARAIEWLASVAGRSVRLIWAGALVLVAVLSSSALVREPRSSATRS